MSAESSAESASLRRRAAMHAALADPARLAIVDTLAEGDASPGELAALLGMSSNLLAHHLRRLESAGIAARSRSEGDRRRSYVRLARDLTADVATNQGRLVLRVVFVCTHNSARSQLAAGLWRKRSRVPAASAGTRPASRVHPTAIAVARSHRTPLGRARTASVADVVRPDDLVVAVCDNAYEEFRPARPSLLHWSVPDPVRVGTTAAFERAYLDLDNRVARFAPTVDLPTEEPADKP